tara:strand:+ start:2640 stop:3167 length:528 start_codon:yes stop_codon:yes gene_type:complete
MKNHPVNNEYVQNLVEGLQFESRKGAPGSAKAKMQDADSENRREATQDAINTQAAQDGGSGVASDIEHGRWEPDIRDEGGSRQRKKVRGAKKPRPFKNTAGRILKKKIDENAEKGYPEQGIEGGTPEAAATHKRIMSKLRSAGGGEEYDRKEAEAKADVKRKRLEAAPALASIQK